MKHAAVPLWMDQYERTGFLVPMFVCSFSCTLYLCFVENLPACRWVDIISWIWKRSFLLDENSDCIGNVHNSFVWVCQCLRRQKDKLKNARIRFAANDVYFWSCTEIAIPWIGDYATHTQSTGSTQYRPFGCLRARVSVSHIIISRCQRKNGMSHVFRFAPQIYYHTFICAGENLFDSTRKSLFATLLLKIDVQNIA